MFTCTYLHRQPKLTAVAAVTLLVTGAGAYAQVGLGLAPMREELKMVPGGQHSGTLTLTNDASPKVRVVAELLDFYIDSTGTPQFGRQYAQEADYSCRQWLLVNPMEMDLGGSSNTVVRYTLRAPQTAPERSYHCAIGFTTQPTADQPRGTGLRTAVQIVSALYVVIGQPALKGSLKGLTEATWRLDMTTMETLHISSPRILARTEAARRFMR